MNLLLTSFACHQYNVPAGSLDLYLPMSHIISEILNKLADEMDKRIQTECRSTEQMIAGFEIERRGEKMLFGVVM